MSRRRGGTPATAPDERIYAVGDLHGCANLFRTMLEVIEAHDQSLPPVAATHLLLVGDLVDRGAHTPDLLRLVHGLATRSDRLIVLRGNHEDMLLRALDGEPGAMHSWIRMGGETTLRSYGIERPREPQDATATARALAEAMTPPIVAWLRGLPLTASSGDYLFVHAGVRPGVPIRRQSRHDLMWIREDFLDNQRDHGAMVVHGHSIVPDIEFHANRIAIDVGAYRTGVLKALYLEGAQHEVLTTEGAARAATAPGPI